VQSKKPSARLPARRCSASNSRAKAPYAVAALNSWARLKPWGKTMKTAFHVLFAPALVLGLASSVLANVN
jgi:hypothetical protein